MAFVTCTQFSKSQAAQDAAAMKAESALLDCAENATGVTTASDCDDSSQGGVITVAKIASAVSGGVAIATDDTIDGDGTTGNPLTVNVTALAGNVAIAVESGGGITGDGTAENPLALDYFYTAGSGLTLSDKTFSVKLGSGLEFADDGSIQLTDEGPCVVDIRTVTADTTLLDEDNTVIVNSSSATTVTIPADLTAGRQFNVIQAGSGTVTIAPASGVTAIAPYNGSLVLEGQNAVVTVLMVSSTVARVFGQTVAA